jgi:uncharacterized membrane protein YfcA
MVPMLVLAGTGQHRAHATSLAAILPIAAVGAASFAAAGEVDYGLAMLLALGALVGAPLGARIMVKARDDFLQASFGCFLVGVGVLMVWP